MTFIWRERSVTVYAIPTEGKLVGTLWVPYMQAIMAYIHSKLQVSASLKCISSFIYLYRFSISQTWNKMVDYF